MLTRSGLQYRLRNRIRQWTGPSLSRARLAAQRTFRRSQTLTRRRNPTNGIGITTQHDERRIYRKKSMPRRFRKRWKRFKNKVLAVSEKDLGTRTVVFNKNYNFNNSTSGQHIVSNVALYPAVSASSSLNDMQNLLATEVGTWTTASGEAVYSASKYIFKSAILDITFRNSSTFTADGTNFSADSRAKLETDIYEILVGHTGSDTSGVYSDLVAMLNAGAGDTLNIGGAGTGVALNLRGVTPWDIPAALSRFKIKILKKTKFMTPNGDTFTYQVRDPRRHVANEIKMNFNGVNMIGWTRWILFISKIVPGLTVGTTANTFQESLDVGLTRKYFYKIEGVSEDRDRYITA